MTQCHKIMFQYFTTVFTGSNTRFQIKAQQDNVQYQGLLLVMLALVGGSNGGFIINMQGEFPGRFIDFRQCIFIKPVA